MEYMSLKSRHNISKVPVLSLLFLFTYGLYLTAFLLLNASNIQSVFDITGISKAINYAVFVLIAGQCLFSRYDLTTQIIMILGIIISFFSFVRSGDTIIFLAFLFVYASQGLNISKFIKFDMLLKIVNMATVFLLCRLDIISDTVYTRAGSMALRHSFGFHNANTLGVLVATIGLEYIFLKFARMKKTDYLIIIFIIILIQIFTNSRSSEFTLLIALFVTVFFRLKMATMIMSNKLVQIILELLFTISSVVSLLMVANFDQLNGSWVRLDTLLTGRLHFINFFYKVYGFRWFGSKVQLLDPKNLSNTYYLVIDNSYSYITFLFGGLLLLLLCVMYFLLVRYAILNKHYAILVAVIPFIFLGLMESINFYPAYNFTLLLMPLISQKNPIRFKNHQ